MATQPTTKPKTATTCPRCTSKMPKGRCALSRADNRTIVCAKCGREEGILAFYGATLPTIEEWPITYNF